MASPATQIGNSVFVPGGRFSPDALDTNRAGRLTDQQRREFTTIDRNWRKGALGFAGIAAVIGVLVLTSTGPAPNAWARPIVGAGALVLAAVLVIYYLPSGDRLSDDVRRGEVLSLEGAMGKHTYETNSGSSSSTSFYLDVADKHFEVGRSEYEAAPEHAWVRLFYLPRSHRVVNLERLPDPPLAENLAHPTLESIGSVLKASFRGSQASRLEAQAELYQAGDAMKAQMAAMQVAHPAPPPAAERDARPLAEAIVGTWSGGVFSATFVADGSMEMVTMGRTQSGHWSVDGQGRLHADVFGRDQAGDAWIAGDTLTVAFGGEGIKLQRAS